MNLFFIATAYLKARLSNTILNITLMTLGVMMMVILLLFSNQVEQRLHQDGAGIDVVVGAKGSPLQLILSTIWHLDIPTGNISLKDAKKLEKHPAVRQVIPISLGDNFKGFRIVGSTPAYLHHFHAKYNSGNIWQKDMQVVIGSEIAKKTGITIGDIFIGSHGLVESGNEHSENPYKVVGILKPTGTVLVRLIVTSMASVWEIHSHHHEDETNDTEDRNHDEHYTESDAKEITALLITYKNYAAAMNFPRQINKETNVQAASPSFEMARLIKLIGFGTDTLFLFGEFLIIISLISVLVGLLNSIRERRYDLAIFRILGATKQKLFLLVVIEGMLIAILGSLIGLILGHLTVELIGNLNEKAGEINLSGFVFLPKIYLFLVLVLFFSFLICLIPAIEAFRTNIRKMISKN